MRVAFIIVLAENPVQEARLLFVPGINHLRQYGKVVVLDEVLGRIGNLYRLTVHGFVYKSKVNAFFYGVPLGFRHHLDDVLMLLSGAVTVNIGDDVVNLLLALLLFLKLLDEGADLFLVEGTPYKLLGRTLVNQKQAVLIHSDDLGAHRTEGSCRS